MPNRILKESICVSESIDALTPAEEIVFYRLLVNCDDFGRMDGRVAVLRAKLFPLRQVPPEQLQSALDRLEALQMIRRYQVKGKPYLLVVNWDAHQTIRAKRSKYPAPESGIAFPQDAEAPGGGPAGALPAPEIGIASLSPEAETARGGPADTSPAPKEQEAARMPEESIPPTATAGADPDHPAPKPDGELARPSGEKAGASNTSAWVADSHPGAEACHPAGEGGGKHPPISETDTPEDGARSALLKPSAKPNPSPARKKFRLSRKRPLHRKQKARAAPDALIRAAIREQSNAPPGGRASAPIHTACEPCAAPGPSPPGDCAPLEGACTHPQADASNCKQMHAHEINCKQMHADASICSRNPIRIQSEKESESVSVSPGKAAAADAEALRAGILTIGKRAAALGMPFVEADRELAQSLMAEFPLDWLLEAMRRAGEGQASCRSWRYIRAILNAWRAKGGIDSVHGGSHTGGEEPGLREAQGDVRTALLIRRY